MMISPNAFAERELKGKTKEEILTSIRSLKREINHLKKVIEDENNPENFIRPSPLTIIKCDREYLEEAITAYKEAGGEYTVTKAERKDQEFNDALSYLEQVIFTYEGFFIGKEERICTIRDDTVFAESFSSYFPTTIEEDDQEPWTKEDFISEMKELHIGEWKKHYTCCDDSEGIQWKLELLFSNGRNTARYFGNDAYPYNFKDVLELFNINKS